MQAKNTIVLEGEVLGGQDGKLIVGTHTIVVKGKNRPFGNNFVLLEIQKVGVAFVECIVQCTKDSLEPGRKYFCMYTKLGTLYACQTLN